MKRRRFLSMLAGAAVAVPGLALAQSAPTRRFAWISSAGADGASVALDSFRAGLADLGYREGRDTRLDVFWTDDSTERMTQAIATLLREPPRVVITQGPVIVPLLRAGATSPVVFGFSGDPVEARIVQSLARPGGNATGMSFLSLDLVGKRMELLKQALPGVRRVAILANPQHAGEQTENRVSREAAERLGLTLQYAEHRSLADVEAAFVAAAQSRCDAAVLFPDARSMRYSARIAALSRKYRLPAISGWAEFAQRGNLLSYGPNLRDGYRRLASFVDRIEHGARPADLPVELPTNVEFVVNLDAARALGVTIPPSLLLRADEVIG